MKLTFTEWATIHIRSIYATYEEFVADTGSDMEFCLFATNLYTETVHYDKGN